MSRLLDFDIAADSYQGDVMQIPLRLGGLGLRNATRTRLAASWASWADTLNMISQGNASIARDIVLALNADQGSNIPPLF